MQENKSLLIVDSKQSKISHISWACRNKGTTAIRDRNHRWKSRGQHHCI